MVESLVRLVAASVLAGFSMSHAAHAADATAGARVTGTVTYRERIALSPTAAVKLQLVDVSRAGAPAEVLGEQLITAGGSQVPFAFEIGYDPARIQPHLTYAVQARIEEDGKLRFISDRRYAVLTRGAPTHVDIVLKAVGAPSPR